jgi:hypothetical protein
VTAERCGSPSPEASTGLVKSQLLQILKKIFKWPASGAVVCSAFFGYITIYISRSNIRCRIDKPFSLSKILSAG